MRHTTPGHDFSATNRTYRRAIAAGNLLPEPLGLSDLAQRCGVSTTHIYMVLHGTRKPSAELVQRLRDTFGPCWAFVIGQTPTLHDPAETARAA